MWLLPFRRAPASAEGSAIPSADSGSRLNGLSLPVLVVGLVRKVAVVGDDARAHLRLQERAGLFPPGQDHPHPHLHHVLGIVGNWHNAVHITAIQAALVGVREDHTMEPLA